MKIKPLLGGSRSAVNNLVEKYQLTLSEDYRLFLEDYNGFVAAEEFELSISGLPEKITMNVLFGVDCDKRWLSQSWWMEQYADELPENALLIGQDVLNGFFLMILSGENVGVYYWDPCLNFAESSESSNAYYIAQGFSEFVEILGGLQKLEA